MDLKAKKNSFSLAFSNGSNVPLWSCNPLPSYKEQFRTIPSKIRSGEEELLMARDLSPGRVTPATGYAPGELTDSIKNKINPLDGGVKFTPECSYSIRL